MFESQPISIQTFIYLNLLNCFKRTNQERISYTKKAYIFIIPNRNESGTSQKYQKRIKKLLISFLLFSITEHLFTQKIIKSLKKELLNVLVFAITNPTKQNRKKKQKTQTA